MINKERPKIHGYHPRYSRFTCGYIFPAIQIVNRCFPEKGHDPVMTSAFCIFFLIFFCFIIIGRKRLKQHM